MTTDIEKAVTLAVQDMLEERDTKLAPCGHLERFWKVEPDNTAWCLMCYIERQAAEIERLRAAQEWALRIMCYVIDAVSYEDEEAAEAGEYALPPKLLQNIDSFLATYQSALEALNEGGTP